MIYSIRLICTTAISLGPSCMLFTILDWPMSVPVDHNQQSVALKWDREGFGFVATVFFRKIFVLRMGIFVNKNIYFKSIKITSKYKTMHISLMNMQLGCSGREPVTGLLAGINLTKLEMNLAKPGVNLSKPGKTQESCHNGLSLIMVYHCFNLFEITLGEIWIKMKYFV